MSTIGAPVTVYSTSTCPWCDRAKQYLTSQNVPFNDIDVAKNYEAALEMVRVSGQQGVPVITAGDEVILGFDQAALARLAERYGGPKRPPLGLLAADADEYLARHPEKAAKTPEGTKGVYVGKIRPGTVAEKAGLEPGDIITAVAGKRTPTMGKLDGLIDTLKAGEKVSVHYLRDGKDENGTLQF
ncbi:MAG: PDZ domain-containing protein [Thermomicrobiales bacterium]|nr:PDZ domain-containing protein [Thermomicrobiales bacterium]